jgi:hypothetical protein
MVHGPFHLNKRKVEVSVSISPPKLLTIPSQTESHGTVSLFPNKPLQMCHNPTNLIFSNLHLRPEDGYMLVIIILIKEYFFGCH